MTSSSAMAERPRKLSDFKGVGQFEVKF